MFPAGMPRLRSCARLLRDILVTTSVTEFPGGHRSIWWTSEVVRYIVMKQMIVFVFENDIAQWTERLPGKTADAM